MSAENPICVTALAGLSPIGHTIEATCASIRTGLNRFAEHPYCQSATLDPETDIPEPITISPIAWLDPELEGVERLFAMAIPSLHQLTQKGRLKRADLARTGLFLALPEEEPATAAQDIDDRAVFALAERTGLAAAPRIEANQAGHAGVLMHAARASELLARGELDFAIVGGVDSYLMVNRLEDLDEAWRGKSARNVDGFLPGEACGWLLLETAEKAAKRHAGIMAVIAAAALDREPETYFSEANSTGAGLSRAIASVLGDGGVSWAVCDLNGESYRAFEWGLVQARLESLANLARVDHPADCLGDVGAASGALLAAYAVECLRRGWASGGSALLWASANRGERAALLIKTAAATGGNHAGHH